MKITSPAFVANQSIPAKYTCDGDNINPPLEISDVPDSAKSLVLIMDDPDIPDYVRQRLGATAFDHWLAYNIPATTRQIAEGQPIGIFGKNSSGNAAYTGPCPPDRQHRYFFKLYALDTLLDLPAGADKASLEKAMEDHMLGQVQLVCLYSRAK